MSAAPMEEFEVEDLDPAGVLAAVAEAERAERAASLRKLELAYQWAVLHPASEDTGVETHGGPAMLVLAAPESLGGDGCPAVAAFTPETFAAALGMSPRAGAQLVGDALALRHRLPLLWKRVQLLEVPAWQARRVAQAAAELDPETHQTREEAAQASWDVQLSHPAPTDFTGTSHLTATGDTLTLKTFADLIGAVAHQLGRAGDPGTLGARKIKAIGLVTMLATGTLTEQSTVDPSDLADLADPRKAAAQAGRVKLVVHVDADDLQIDGHGDTGFGVCRVEKLGAVSLARLRTWVGHHHVQLLPVLNMARRDAVDQHDPPDWMVELVRLRDGHCISPRCAVDARACDLDHLVPYQPLEEGGPPGQTRPDNLACLCRRHHRARPSELGATPARPPGTTGGAGRTPRRTWSAATAAAPARSAETEGLALGGGHPP